MDVNQITLRSHSCEYVKEITLNLLLCECPLSVRARPSPALFKGLSPPPNCPGVFPGRCCLLRPHLICALQSPGCELPLCLATGHCACNSGCPLPHSLTPNSSYHCLFYFSVSDVDICFPLIPHETAQTGVSFKILLMTQSKKRELYIIRRQAISWLLDVAVLEARIFSALVSSSIPACCPGEGTNVLLPIHGAPSSLFLLLRIRFLVNLAAHSTSTEKEEFSVVTCLSFTLKLIH